MYEMCIPDWLRAVPLHLLLHVKHHVQINQVHVEIYGVCGHVEHIYMYREFLYD